MTIASQSVEFSAPVTGARLVEAVKTIAESGSSTRFTSDKSFNDGNVIIPGQTSGYPYQQLAVVSSEDGLGVRPEREYAGCVVKNYSWPGSVYLVGYENDSIISAVNDFAAKLKQEIDGGAPEVPSVWPQTVTVCASCQRILQRNSDEPWHCPTHGPDTTALVLKVVPA